MALASFSLWDHLAFAGLRFPAAESFTPFTEWRPRKELQMFNHLAMDAVERSLVADKEKKVEPMGP